MATINMNLDLPVVLTTIGPDWANQLNVALETVDQHDHTSGKGVKVPLSGINVGMDFNFLNFKIYNLRSTQYQSQVNPLSGASNANSLSTSGGDLYWTNGSGTAVQITSGGSVITVPATVQAFALTSIASDLIISPSDTFVGILVDTTLARSITLPLASSVVAGRMFLIKDSDGLANTNNITIQTTGTDTIDGASSYIVQSNYATVWAVSDGVSSWQIF